MKLTHLEDSLLTHEAGNLVDELITWVTAPIMTPSHHDTAQNPLKAIVGTAATLASCNGLGACWPEEADRLMAKRWHRSTTAMNLSERQWHTQRVSSWPGVCLVRWVHYVTSSKGRSPSSDEALVAAHYDAKVSDSEEVLFEGKMC